MYFQLFARHLHSAYHISLCVLLMQDNQMASQRTRDLGGEDLLAVYQFARRVWWLRAPLFHREHPSHPMWKLGFFDEARRDGTWDRWCSVVLSWHTEVDGLMAAFASPVGAIANALPPQLLVARLMESVKVLCCQSLLCLFVYV